MHNHDAPQRRLSTFSLVCLVFGTVVGAGIFKAPSIVAAQSGSGAEFLLAWLIGGLISVAGALCYAELSTTYPSAGGEYHFLSRSFGKNLSFFYVWARATVIVTGSMAILAITLGDYMAAIWPLGPYSSFIWAAGVIVILSLVNLIGIHQSTFTQNTFTILEFLGILAVIVAGFYAGNATPSLDLLTQKTGDTNYGLAMVFVLLTFGGWNEVAYASAEARDEKRGIWRALSLGLGAVTIMYLLANVAYLKALGLNGIANSPAAAYDVFILAFGKGSAMVFGMIVIFSCLNSINATIIFGARSNYAMGNDYRVFSWLGKWHSSGNPRNSIILQAGIACSLIVFAAMTSQGFKALVEFTAPVFWFFVLLVGVSLILQRVRDPNTERPFKVPFYPVLPLVFIGSTAWLLWSSLVYTGAGAWISLVVLLSGCIPLLLNRRHTLTPMPESVT
ncbi:MAG: amino acid permease [Oxalobacteraceae bacterium]|nr:amino acid permease [Oxalobacteraceae bacterium]